MSTKVTNKLNGTSLKKRSAVTGKFKPTAPAKWETPTKMVT